MATLEIIGMPQSNFVCTVRIAANEKGVSHDLTSARPRSPELAAIHPMGRMPVLRHGDVVMFETKAICTYIDRAFAGPALSPADALGAAEVEQWASFINTSFQPIAMMEYTQSYFFNVLPDGSPNRPRIDAALPGLEKHLGIFDRAVAKTGHLVGASFTIADMLLLPMMFYLKKLPESAAMIARLPALSAWYERLSARPAFVAATPPPMPGR